VVWRPVTAMGGEVMNDEKKVCEICVRRGRKGEKKNSGSRIPE
jgi:hypothetical protein